MKNILNFFNDRRKHTRKTLKANILLKAGVDFQGDGYVKDISLEGACVQSPNLFDSIEFEQACVFLNATLIIFLPSESLTISGTIIRANAVEKELAISIFLTSDNEKWKSLCA